MGLETGPQWELSEVTGNSQKAQSHGQEVRDPIQVKGGEGHHGNAQGQQQLAGQSEYLTETNKYR